MFVLRYQACYHEAKCLFEIIVWMPVDKGYVALVGMILINVHTSLHFQVAHIQNIFLK